MFTVLCGCALGGAGLCMLAWRKQEPFVVPGVKTTRVKPIVALLMFGLAALCFMAAASGPDDEGGGDAKEAQPVHSGRRGDQR